MIFSVQVLTCWYATILMWVKCICNNLHNTSVHMSIDMRQFLMCVTVFATSYKMLMFVLDFNLCLTTTMIGWLRINSIALFNFNIPIKMKNLRFFSYHVLSLAIIVFILCNRYWFPRSLPDTLKEFNFLPLPRTIIANLVSF